MILQEILTTISNYIEQSDKKSNTYRTLSALKTDIALLVDSKMDKVINKDICYQCSICCKICISLKEKKYCLDCYDKFID